MKALAALALRLGVPWLCAAGLMPLVSASAVGQPNAAQQAAGIAAHLPEFEVASIRPTDMGKDFSVGLFTYPGGRVVARGCTLQILLMEALNVQRFQISGGPRWITEDRFEIEAKPPESSAASNSNPTSIKLPPNEEQRKMLVALLMDRFQLKFHRVVKEGPVLVLLKGDKDLRLHAPKDANEFSWAGGVEGGRPSASGVRGVNISMPQLTDRLSGWLGRPVVDRTGLHGAFDFEFRTGNDDSEAEADVASSILSSMKGIGLKLEPGKGPVDTVVIDHAEKPSAN